MVQKHVMIKHFLTLNFTKITNIYSTEESDKTIKNNIDYSFETFLTLEK